MEYIQDNTQISVNLKQYKYTFYKSIKSIKDFLQVTIWVHFLSIDTFKESMHLKNHHKLHCQIFLPSKSFRVRYERMKCV